MYLGQREEPWVTTHFALSMFHIDLHRARTDYDQFVHANLAARSPLTELNPNDSRILGSDRFATQLLGNAWSPRTRKTLDDLIDDACQQFALPRNALNSPSRHRTTTLARAWIAHQAITLRITSLSQVAHHFGRTEGALRQSVKRYFNYP